MTTTITTAKTRKLTYFQYAATLLGGLAIAALAPAAANAQPVSGSGGGAGCTHTDKDGYDIPIDDGQDVYVDGKIVSCRNGKIIVTTPPARTGDNSVRPSIVGKLPAAKFG